jgi:thiol:disulfide interchange protein
MRRILGLALAGLLGLAVASCDPANSGKSGPVFHNISVSEALAEAGRQNKIVVVDFGATWCGPCRQMEHTTFSDPDVKKFLRDHTIALKVDIDEQPEVANQFGVKSIPTMVFLNAQGEQLARTVGYRSPQQFLAAANKLKT